MDKFSFRERHCCEKWNPSGESIGWGKGSEWQWQQFGCGARPISADVSSYEQLIMLLLFSEKLHAAESRSIHETMSDLYVPNSTDFLPLTFGRGKKALGIIELYQLGYTPGTRNDPWIYKDIKATANRLWAIYVLNRCYMLYLGSCISEEDRVSRLPQRRTHQWHWWSITRWVQSRRSCAPTRTEHTGFAQAGYYHLDLFQLLDWTGQLCASVPLPTLETSCTRARCGRTERRGDR